MKKQDIIAGIVIGEAIAWLLFLIVSHIVSSANEKGVKVGALFEFAASQTGLFILTVGFPILIIIGLWIAERISQKIPIIMRIAKFGVVGVLNTLLFMGVNNLLVFLTDRTEGYMFDSFVVLAFIVANVNSYLWNKFWTFEVTGISRAKTEFTQFFLVSLAALIVNLGVVHVLVNITKAPSSIDPVQWDNIAWIIGSIAALILNFIGYKYFVFRKKDVQPESPAQNVINNI